MHTMALLRIPKPRIPAFARSDEPLMGEIRPIMDANNQSLMSRSLTVRRNKSCLPIFSLVFIISMAFALYTNHAWEDYYITFRASKNLAMGQGLVFTPGERIHTFTSPLGTLIPALLSFATGNSSDALVLWLFRVLSSAALALAAVLLLRLARLMSLRLLVTVFLIGMVALDAKTIDFTINGMETGLMLLFLCLTLNALIEPGRHPAIKLGLAWAGLMWTRPDSFIYIGGLGLGFVLFNARTSHAADRAAKIRLFLIAGFIAALLYLPWILWAWHYYGSPIPNTVAAKGLGRHSTMMDILKTFPFYPFISMFLSRCFSACFLPAYAGPGDWPILLFTWSRLLTWVGAFAWMLPALERKYRAVSLTVMLIGFYLDAISPYPFPWYLPPCTLLSAFVLSGIFQQIPGWLRQSRIFGKSRTPGAALSWSLRGFLVLALSLTITLSALAAYQLRIQQRVIEEGNRREIGLWLAAHSTSKSETVFLECLGYIGYYSQLKMLDFPGLSSQEVIKARKKLGSDETAGLIRALKPDWLVLRPGEVKTIEAADPDLFVRAYQKVKIFDVSDKVASYRWLPGRGYLTKDQIFIIFKRLLKS